MHENSSTYSSILAFFLVILAFFVSLYGIGDYPIWNKDEGLYAEAVREMFLNNNFFDPYFNYEHRWQKPILIYWVLSASSYVFGVNEFGIRFGLWALGALSALVVFFLAQRMYGDKKLSIFAVLFFVTSFAYILQTRHIATHMLLLFTTLLAFFVLWEIVSKGGSRTKSILFGLTLGLSFLAKGPVGPALVLVTGLVVGGGMIAKNFKSFLKNFGVVLVVFLLVSLPWYGYMLYTYGGEYLAFLNHEMFDRVSNNITPNSSPFFYFGAFSGNFSPWSVLFWVALVLFLIKSSRHLKDSFSRANMFLLVSIVVIMGLFSLSASKLPAYVFPAQPLAAILLASLLFSQKKDIFIKIALYLTMIIYIVALFILSLAYFDKIWVILAVVLSAIALLAFRGRYELSKVAMLALGGYFMIVSNIYSEVQEFFPYKRFGTQVSTMDSSYKFYEYGFFRESLPFYAKRKLNDFNPKSPPKEPFILVTDIKNSKLLGDEFLVQKIDESRYYRGSDSDVFKMINILKGFKEEGDKIGEVVLLKVFPLKSGDKIEL